MFIRWNVAALLLTLTLGQSIAFGQFDEGDIAVGVDSQGRLKVLVPEGIVYLPAVDGLLVGWAANEPGFDHVEAADPPNDVFPLQAGAQIRIHADAIQPAFKAWAANLSSSIDAAGEELFLGDDELHAHLVWHIDSQDAGFDPEGTLWSLTFRLLDTGSTGYLPSDPITMTFSNVAVPAVSAWGLVAVFLLLLTGGTILIRRSSAVGAGRAA